MLRADTFTALGCALKYRESAERAVYAAAPEYFEIELKCRDMMTVLTKKVLGRFSDREWHHRIPGKDVTENDVYVNRGVLGSGCDDGTVVDNINALTSELYVPPQAGC